MEYNNIMLLKLVEGEIVETYTTGESLKIKKDYEIEVLVDKEEYTVKIPEFGVYAMHNNLNSLKTSILSQMAFYYEYYDKDNMPQSMDYVNIKKLNNILIKE